MPFYEYECASCKFYCEVMQKISDAPLKKCPSCGKSTLKKLVSAPNFRLKGGGWYETDFKSEQ
jgi:putative FmdB family regulatory protein